ncbi:MAG: UDP-N-acetylglucosamine 1-carboxyvinyltransferase [Clostridia bacterium]|jgi:UDP-N-acetylglucosamine 1-carboxyvinyltransferase|nr:UDP-N-acetylglucosamine 1-carboxyvinyltransferase [Clostridia bacterium]
MEKYIINGGNRLYGSVEIQTAKNSVLPVLAATVLTDEKVRILNVPNISDVKNMVKILTRLGCKAVYDGNDLVVDGSSADCYEIPSELAHELRSSVFLLGSVISRFRMAKIAYPGGCDIGLRPVDLHLTGLKKLGVDITEENGYIICKCEKLRGTEIMLDCPSVGATENIMLAAVRADGTTVIKNAAREPEIEDLQRLLNLMGAKVRGAGSSSVIIEGVEKLNGCDFLPIPDRIEAGTFLVGAAMCGGEVELNRVCAENVSSLLHKLRENGCKISINNDKIILENHKRLTSVKSIETQPYPGFPTDLQAQITALCCVCRGHSIITENLFETRFKYVPELRKMGADVTVINRNAFVRGVERFKGATVVAHDLRGGAALVLAGLAAEGRSEILDISHIDRGYGSYEYKLRKLGGDIVRVSV